MNTIAARPCVGRWYVRWDSGELFQVTRYDPEADSIEIQSFDGDAYELEAEAWRTFPLGIAEPPEGWTTLIYVPGIGDDLDRPEAGAAPWDWTQPLEPLKGSAEEEAAAYWGEEPETQIEDASATDLPPDAKAGVHYHFHAPDLESLRNALGSRELLDGTSGC